MNTIESNILIAEFMGADYVAFKDSHIPLSEGLIRVPNHGICFIKGDATSAIDVLSYNTSWNWIMPVIEKIGKLNYRTEIKYNPDNLIHYCKIHSIDVQDWQQIKCVYIAIIEFINWYNKNT